jgi:integrase
MAPRKIKNRRLGCWIEATPSGFLRLRFRWHIPSAAGLHKFSETTELRDTPENRGELMKQAAIIGAEIAANRFDYLRWFPNGTKAAHFRSTEQLTVRSERERSPAIGRFYESWIKRKVPPFVRVSAARDYHDHFRLHILDRLGDLPLAELSLEHLEDLRAHLQTQRNLSIKTIRNVIDGSLRALVRDAIKAGISARFPFPSLDWPRRTVPGPNPFAEEERDKLLNYFLRKTWRLGGFGGRYESRTYYPYYAFLFTLFYTGLRPSEAVALRVKSLDLKTGVLFVERSRSYRSEAAPKTASAVRVVRLTPTNVEVLRNVIDLRAEPDTYVFRNSFGDPIDQKSFYKTFCKAQQAVGIRLRDLYATKDTYVSTALTKGVNLTWLSEQTGVAEATLRSHYGRFIHTSLSDAMELAKIEDGGLKTGDFAPRLPHRGFLPQGNPAKFGDFLVSRPGLEPGTP